jgi:hypothetical protein
MSLTDVKKSISLSRKIPKEMKELILPLATTSSRYTNGMVFGLRKPTELNKISLKARGVSFGANKDGFFVYTHRARCKSHKDFRKITKKEIDFIESTG